MKKREMSSEQFRPALSQVFGSEARTKLVAVLVERRAELLTATILCDLADVSQSEFHRDHKPVLFDFGLLERRESDDAENLKYTLADTEQASYVVKAHYALQSQLEGSGQLLTGNIKEFVK